MSGALANVVLGLVTSLLSGTAVWLGQRLYGLRRRRREAAFFGVRPTERCLLVMNRMPANPKGMRHSDIHALIDLAVQVRELGGEPEMTVFDQLTEVPGQQAEFCVGGPQSNERTKAHFAHYLPGVALRPYNPNRRDSVGIVVGDQRFYWDPEEQAHAVLARLVPPSGTRPVFVICGQTATANRGAVAYLLRETARLRRLAGQNGGQFCLVLRVSSPRQYGHRMVELVRDVTEAALTPSPSQSRSQSK